MKHKILLLALLAVSLSTDAFAQLTVSGPASSSSCESLEQHYRPEFDLLMRQLESGVQAARRRMVRFQSNPQILAYLRTEKQIAELEQSAGTSRSEIVRLQDQLSVQLASLPTNRLRHGCVRGYRLDIAGAACVLASFVGNESMDRVRNFESRTNVPVFIDSIRYEDGPLHSWVEISNGGAVLEADIGIILDTNNRPSLRITYHRFTHNPSGSAYTEVPYSLHEYIRMQVGRGNACDVNASTGDVTVGTSDEATFNGHSASAAI